MWKIWKIIANQQKSKIILGEPPGSQPAPPRAFERAIDGVLFLVNEIQFQSNKVWYKVSLCENFQRQSCSMTIPPSNGP